MIFMNTVELQRSKHQTIKLNGEGTMQWVRGHRHDFFWWNCSKMAKELLSEEA